MFVTSSKRITLTLPDDKSIIIQKMGESKLGIEAPSNVMIDADDLVRRHSENEIIFRAVVRDGKVVLYREAFISFPTEDLHKIAGLVQKEVDKIK